MARSPFNYDWIFLGSFVLALFFYTVVVIKLLFLYTVRSSHIIIKKLYHLLFQNVQQSKDQTSYFIWICKCTTLVVHLKWSSRCLNLKQQSASFYTFKLQQKQQSINCCTRQVGVPCCCCCYAMPIHHHSHPQGTLCCRVQTLQY